MKRISISITGVLRDITTKLISLNNKYNEKEFEGELPDLDFIVKSLLWSVHFSFSVIRMN